MNILKLTGHSFLGLSVIAAFVSTRVILSPISGINPTYSFISVGSSCLFFLNGVLALEINRRSERTDEFVDWLLDLRKLLEEVVYPLNSGALYKIGVWLSSMFLSQAGWVLIANIPGLLISGEVQRSKFIRVASDGSSSSLNVVNSVLEEDVEKTIKRFFTIRRFDERRGLFWVYKRRDVAIGYALVLPGFSIGGYRKLQVSFLQAGIEEVGQHINLILGDIIRRREALGNEGQTGMLRRLSHEISGELQGAQNMLASQIAQHDHRAPPPKLFKIRTALWRAWFLIDQLRDIPIFEDGWLPISPGSVLLMNEIETILTEARSAWPDYNFITNIGSLSESKLIVLADFNLRSILRNLIFNAASFSPDYGLITITVSIASNKREVCLTIEDEGPGVTPDQAEVIFDPLVSSKRENDYMLRRSGVGLPIARTIARTYGGDLKACSVEENKRSSKFKLLLPLAKSYRVA